MLWVWSWQSCIVGITTLGSDGKMSQEVGGAIGGITRRRLCYGMSIDTRTAETTAAAHCCDDIICCYDVIFMMMSFVVVLCGHLNSIHW